MKKVLFLLCTASYLFSSENVPKLKLLSLHATAEKLSQDLEKRQSMRDRFKLISSLKNKTGEYAQVVLACHEAHKKQFELKKSWSGKINTITDDGAFIITTDSTNFFLNQNDPCQEYSYLPKGLRAYQDHTGYITTVVLAKDNLHAVSCSYDKTLKYWDLKQDKPLCTLNGHTGWVEHAVISKDDANVLSASKDNTLRWWDLKSGASVYTLQGHTKHINHIALSPDATKALSCSDDNTIKVWDLKEGKMLHSLNCLTHKSVFAIFSPDGSKILSQSKNNTLTLWDTLTGQIVQKIKDLPHKNIGWAITKDNKRVISISDYFCSLWDMASGKKIHSIANNRTKGLPEIIYNANALLRQTNPAIHFSDVIHYNKDIVMQERAFADLTTGSIYTIQDLSSTFLPMPKPKPARINTSSYCIQTSDCPRAVGLLKVAQDRQKKKLLFETSFAKQRLAHYPTSNYLVGK